jgi:ketosteroid isomerase-like protein
MTRDEATTLVRTVIGAASDRDIARVMAMYAEDAVSKVVDFTVETPRGPRARSGSLISTRRRTPSVIWRPVTWPGRS